MRIRDTDGIPAGTGHPRDLLRRERRSGYPAEYLLARIRGRRSRLIRDWRAPLAAATPAEFLSSPLYQGFVRERSLDGLWRSLLREQGWVFGQMEEGLRRALAPYFLYTELRTVLICLRLLQSGKTQQIGEVLAGCLLDERVQAVLAERDAEAGAAGLEEVLVPLSGAFRGLAAEYREAGLRGLEQRIVRNYLESVLVRTLHPSLRELFVRIIDARNILALYKSLKSGARDRSVFIEGGTVTTGRLQELLERDDLLAVTGMVRLASGIAISAPEPTQVEVALYRGITRHLKREGRDPLGTVVVLEYLWRCSLEVMNLGVLFAGRVLAREEAAAELVS
jgi:vacuolar-type H+-ATPase subunit C/Vma6